MDTTYTNFNYNNNVFQYNYNIFKNNLHIGIGTSYPQHELDIKGNFSSSHNLNINGGLFYNNYTDNTTNLLAYNVNTNQIYPLKLINQTNSYNTNKYDWVLNNNNLKLEFHNKNDNTIIPYQSINYSIDNNILIYSKYNITITHIFLYQLQQNNNILPSIGIYKLNVNNTEKTFTAINSFYYKLNTPITLNKNTQNTITLTKGSATNNLNNNTTITVPENSNTYYFDGIDINNKVFGVTTGIYNFTNIPYEYPLAILDTTNITINTQNSNFNNKITQSININTSNENNFNDSYDFYFNDIKFSFNNTFDDDISLLTYSSHSNHSNNVTPFLGGENIFRFKKQDYPDLLHTITHNTLTTNISSTTDVITVSIDTTNSPTNYYKFSYKTGTDITLTDITLNNTTHFYLTKNTQYILKSIPEDNALAFFDNNDNVATNIHIIYYENTNYTTVNSIKYYYGNISFIITETFSNTISIKSKTNDFMGGQNLFMYNFNYPLLPEYDSLASSPNEITVSTELVNSSNIYVFTYGSPSSTDYSFNTTTKFQIVKGNTYKLTNIPSGHPLAILDNTNITIETGSSTPVSTNITVSNFSGTYDFYSGDLIFSVNSNSTLTDISLYCLNHGFMDGQNILQIIDNANIINLVNKGTLNTFNITNDNSYYAFTDSTTSTTVNLNNITKYYVSTDNYYTLLNIPTAHPLGFIDTNNITVFSDNTVQQLSINNTNYNFYTGNITFKIKNSFSNDISIYCKNHGFMGGKNILRSKDFETNITDLVSQQEITIGYDSINDCYTFTPYGSSTITLNTNNKFFVNNTNTYTFKNIPNNLPITLLSNNITFTQYDYIKSINTGNGSINYTFYYGTLQFTVNNIFNNFISIYSYSDTYLGGQNILTYGTVTSNNHINLLGYYNFNSGLLWNQNTSNDLFINNKIGIGTTTSYTSQLYVNKSAKSTNTNVNNKTNVHNSHITNINNSNSANIEYITSNKLTINSTNQNVGIGTTHSNDLLHIGNDFIVNRNSNVYFKNASFMNNINFNHNIKISLNNNPLIIFSNNNFNYTQKLNNIKLEQKYHYDINYVNTSYINLLPNTDINISNTGSYYSINDNSVNDNIFTLIQGSYTFINIPYTHPLAIINNTDITIDTINSSYNNKSIVSINDTTSNEIDLTGNYNFYINDISFKFNNEFSEDVSIYCSNHGFMGGQNLFRFKKTDYPDLNLNTAYNVFINVTVENSYYKFDNISTQNNKFYFITGTQDYHWDIPDSHPLGFPTNNITEFASFGGNSIDASQHTNYDSNYTYYTGRIKIRFVSTTHDDISIKCSYHGYMGGHNVLRYKTFSDTIVDTITDLPTSEITVTNINSKYYFNGTDVSITKKYYVNNTDTYTFKTIPSEHPLGILTNNLIYTPYVYQKTGIGTTTNYNFYYGTLKFNVINKFTNPISINCYNHGYMGGQNILRYKEPDIIDFKLLSNKICIKNNLNLNSNNSNSNSNNILTVNGNANITNNIVVGGTLKINNLQNIETKKEIKVINFKNTNYLLNKGHTHSNYISTQNFKTKYLTLPYASNSNKKKGGLYYDKVNNTIVGNNGQDITFLSEQRVNQIKFIFDYKFVGQADLLYTTTKHINTNDINISNKLILPKTSEYTKNNYNKSNIGSMRFNNNTLHPQIHNGYNWCSVKYTNTESQLNYISFDNLSLLVPSFHNRRFNYQYTQNTKPDFVTFSINPFSILNILFKQSNSLIHTETISNTSPQHISQNIDIKTNIVSDFNQLEITSKKFKSSNHINYTCSFSYVSNLLQNFISKYEYFTLTLENNTLDIFRLTSSLIPTNLKYSNIFQSNLDNLQLNNGQNVHIDENKLYRKDIQKIFYDRYDKKFRRNYYNKLYELYYHSTLKTLKLIFHKNLLINQNQHISSFSKEDILGSSLNDVYYNYNTRTYQKKINNTIQELEFEAPSNVFVFVTLRKGLYEHELTNIIYNEDSNKLIQTYYSVQYNIIYHNEQFIQAVTSVVLDTPIMNTNNKINYQIIDPKPILDYTYKELYEYDIINTHYKSKTYDINYNITDDQFYLENIGNSHKFKLITNGDNVVAALEYVTCKLKQFNL